MENTISFTFSEDNDATSELLKMIDEENWGELLHAVLQHWTQSTIDNRANWANWVNWAEALARAGRDVINPTALDRAFPLKELSYEKIMEIDLKLLSMADYLVQLPGWEDSRGANRELGYALAMGLPVFSLEELLEEGSHADEPARNL